MIKDTDKLKTIVFTAVFAVVCGVGISVAVFFAGTNKMPMATQTGTVFNEPKLKVHVKGEVKSPGIYELTTDKRVQDAIDAAGGALETGDSSSLSLAALLKDGQTITIPSKAERQNTPPPENNQPSPKKDGKININTADTAQLETLPGIGPSIAERIVEYRSENGNFSNLEDVMNVSGIGEKKFEQLKDYICN